MTQPEFKTDSKIHSSLEYLFAGEEFRTENVQAELGYRLLDDANLRGIMPTFPDTVRHRLLRETLDEQRERRENPRSNFAQRLFGVIQKFSDGADRIEISDPFTCEHLERNAYDDVTTTWIEVKSVSYEGTIAVNKQKFEFVPGKKLVTVTTGHIYEPGYARHGSTFTLAPGAVEPSVSYQGSPEQLLLIDPSKSPTANMLNVIATAITLRK